MKPLISRIIHQSGDGYRLATDHEVVELEFQSMHGHCSDIGARVEGVI